MAIRKGQHYLRNAAEVLDQKELIGARGAIAYNGAVVTYILPVDHEDQSELEFIISCLTQDHAIADWEGMPVILQHRDDVNQRVVFHLNDSGHSQSRMLLNGNYRATSYWPWHSSSTEITNTNESKHDVETVDGELKGEIAINKQGETLLSFESNDQAYENKRLQFIVHDINGAIQEQIELVLSHEPQSNQYTAQWTGILFSASPANFLFGIPAHQMIEPDPERDSHDQLEDDEQTDENDNEAEE